MISLNNKKYSSLYILAKTLNSLGFILVAIICANIGDNFELFKNFAPGFIFCFLGDFILGFYNDTKKQKYFLIGLGLFLLGHVAFVIAFTTIQSFMLVDLIFPVIAIAITVGLNKLPNMNCEKMKPIVCIYSFFVSLLFAKSIHIFYIIRTTQMFSLTFGATLFLISDILILFLYFYMKKSPLVAILNLATYYYGIFFIALSLLF
jgi:uncharacterized membrane protein YhhN